MWVRLIDTDVRRCKATIGIILLPELKELAAMLRILKSINSEKHNDSFAANSDDKFSSVVGLVVLFNKSILGNVIAITSACRIDLTKLSEL